MRSARRGVDVLAVLLASLAAVGMCRGASASAADEEQTVRDWLETFYQQAERRYYAFSNATWNFNVNITEENKRRMVSVGRVHHRRSQWRPKAPPATQNASQKRGRGQDIMFGGGGA